MRIDVHSHILPNMDDGAQSAEESLKLLALLKKDGVDAVAATPHLHLHRQSATDFLRKREQRAETLFKALNDSDRGGDYPKIVLGAEVLFSASVGELSPSQLKNLCIEGTDYLLIELPYCAFSRSFLTQFSGFVSGCGCGVILAHIERYYEYNGSEQMDELLSCDCLAQANCDSLLSARSRKLLLKLIGSGAVRLLGTDAHSVKERPPRFAKAERVIRGKLSDEAFEDMMETARQILDNDSESFYV